MKRSIMPDYMPTLDFQQPPPAKEPAQWIRPLLELASPLIGLVLYLLGIANQHPLLSKVLLIAIIAALVFLSIRYIVEFGRWGFRKYVERRFTTREDEQLCKLLKRFDRFTSPNDGRALLSILRSASSANPPIGRLLNSYSLDGWIESFRQQLTLPPRSLDEFLQRVREFGTLIATFNRNFAVSAQKELALAPPIQPQYITQLEEFRDEFNALLRDIEEWGESVAASAQKLKGAAGLDHRLVPRAYFERVPSFSQATTVTINGK
ncbi:MAG: hypothetical protein ABSG52_02990 [Terriglobales bacterium]